MADFLDLRGQGVRPESYFLLEGAGLRRVAFAAQALRQLGDALLDDLAVGGDAQRSVNRPAEVAIHILKDWDVTDGLMVFEVEFVTPEIGTLEAHEMPVGFVPLVAGVHLIRPQLGQSAPGVRNEWDVGRQFTLAGSNAAWSLRSKVLSD